MNINNTVLQKKFITEIETTQASFNLLTLPYCRYKHARSDWLPSKSQLHHWLMNSCCNIYDCC